MFEKIKNNYKLNHLSGDILAAIIVAVMLIPQGLAYAILAGLPPQMGLFASILPMIAYGLFGSSKFLSVGPTAIVSVMSMSSVYGLSGGNPEKMIVFSIGLAFMVGVVLFVMGIFKMGFIANFLSVPILNGFVIGVSILIAVGQLKYVLGINIKSDNVLEVIKTLNYNFQYINIFSLWLGLFGLFVLVLNKKIIKLVFNIFNINKKWIEMISKITPMVLILGSTYYISKYLNSDNKPIVDVVGFIPTGLPKISFPEISVSMIQDLFLSAILIALIGFIESVSVAKKLANKKNQLINANKELLGLGASNLASAISGGMVVTGGLSRTMVNFTAGANSQIASVLSAIFISVAVLLITDYLYYLPLSILASTIIFAVLSLINFNEVKAVFLYDKAEGWSMLITILAVLFIGVEKGLLIGVLLAILVLVIKANQVHIAILGNIENTEQFRNINRYKTIKNDNVLILRIDENLNFLNIAKIKNKIEELVSNQKNIKVLILSFSSINQIDISAISEIDKLNEKLSENDIILYYSDIKGPVLDKIKKTQIYEKIKNNIILSTYDAFKKVSIHE